jgi:hypothetical protein
MKAPPRIEFIRKLAAAAASEIPGIAKKTLPQARTAIAAYAAMKAPPRMPPEPRAAA